MQSSITNFAHSATPVTLPYFFYFIWQDVGYYLCYMSTIKHDILSRTDLDFLVHRFYAHLLNDSQLKQFFQAPIHIDWDTHFPKLVDFWEQIVFNTGSYAGNPMQVHAALSAKIPIQAEHLAEWVSWFHQTVDDYFEGENATLIKQSAYSIAKVMEWKIALKPTE